MKFEIKSDLPYETRQEIDRIQAIPSAQRLTTEANFLTALAPYLTNQILLQDPDGLIVIASGNTVPTSYPNFKVGGLFIDVDSTAIYYNSGTALEATWDNLNSISSAEIGAGAVTAAKLAASLDMTSHAMTNVAIEEGTPVNAVAASGILTSDNTDVTDGDTVTIGTVTYRFKDTPAQINDVQRHGTTADTTLANLVAAINGSGTPGVEYFTGTVANPNFTSSTVSAHAITITAIVKGVAGNAFAKTESSSHLDWDGVGAVMTGGVDGTVGIANKMLVDATYLYHAVSANTIADANWRRIALGSAY